MVIHKIKEKWDEHKEGWIGSIVYLIIGFALALFLNMILGVVLHTDTPIVAVFSESMIPTMYKGDMVVVAGASDLKIGDIIVFDVPDRRYPIIHRIYNITESGIMTKGDNNLFVDPWRTKEESIHGVALFKLPFLGWVKIIFTELTGI